jgi:hypothetical protein
LLRLAGGSIEKKNPADIRIAERGTRYAQTRQAEKGKLQSCEYLKNKGKNHNNAGLRVPARKKGEF